jgi:hypothetical protein
VVGAAIKVAKIATGEIEEDRESRRAVPPSWAEGAARLAQTVHPADECVLKESR